MGFSVESTLKLATTVSFYIFTNLLQNIILPLDVVEKTQLKTKGEYPRKVYPLPYFVLTKAHSEDRPI